MHILVATDGQLDGEQVVRFCGPLAGPDGSVTVFTVAEVPRQLLAELRTDFGEQAPPTVVPDAEYVGSAGSGTGPVGWPGDDAMVERYLHDKKDSITGPIVAAFAAAGISATGRVAESESATAAILDILRNEKVDVVAIGSHGQGRFEGLLGSTGTKLTRLSPCPVLVLRTN